MLVKRFSLLCVMATGILLSGTISAKAEGDIIKPGFDHKLPNVPGKSLRVVEVIYPPGTSSLPHTHAPSAFIYAYVVQGKIVSQIAGQAEHVYNAGESWYEDPGAHHIVSRNASKTEPAKLLAVFIVDNDDNELTKLDRPK
ncbi:cupin domain-containing protein [Aristophania vespae]|uniref:cupin domain-containing protein n=1 Tax=Aristophania vespae TaxID=2697033 RepID=UPI0023511514|nr:cupin domain-containing protein [Aristophania vespae]UMM64018.1 hypothetical protein DM15PD_09990 [Aristophania vespae]